MAIAPPASARRPTPAKDFWRGPLVPAAIVVTAGILADRYFSIPVLISLLLVAVSLAAWGLGQVRNKNGLPVAYLLLAGFGVGAAWHHAWRFESAANDLGQLAPVDPQPAQVRGVLDEEPRLTPANADPLRSLPQPEFTTTVLRATHLRKGDEWVEVSGRVLLVAAHIMQDCHIGDEVEVTGRLGQLREPANPGEFDVAGFLADQGIHCRLESRKTPAGVVRRQRGWTTSFWGWLAVIKNRGQRELARALPPETSGLAQALLLGDGSPLTAADWLKYVRTGVIHVLAISGQHLVVLALFLWWTLRLLGVRRARGAAVVAIFLMGYALLTGGRPPALRSAVSGCAACGGLLLHRRVHGANLFALAWLVVLALNPTDVFGSGCLLSFLSVAVLYWGVGPWLNRRDVDPARQLLNEQRPPWLRALRWLGRLVLDSYVVTLAIWLAITPLAASRYSLVSPAGLVLGPPLTLLTSVALLAGFVFLLLAVVGSPFTALLATVVHYSLFACEYLVDAADGCGWSFFYVGEVATWWLVTFYLALLLFLTLPRLRASWRRILPAGLGWLAVGLLAAAVHLPSDELRVSFLAVGHGGCTVLETPDGRTLLYDAGAIAGPEVAQRQIAPFLWHRGIKRIDEVFLSHADLDHFNGLVGLLDRFAVGRVSCTPTFADKSTPAVHRTLEVLKARGVPTRIVKAGDVLRAGDVELRVLHPPAHGPDGNENARSLVLEVRHAGHVLLLTGDLEGAGQAMVLGRERRTCDVLMAPHHGSPKANPAALAAWANPRVVVSCQGPPRSAGPLLAAFDRPNIAVLPTWTHGTITIHSRADGMIIETFVTRRSLTLRTRT